MGNVSQFCNLLFNRRRCSQCYVMLSYFVLFYPVNEGFFRSFGSKSDGRSYCAVEAGAF